MNRLKIACLASLLIATGCGEKSKKPTASNADEAPKQEQRAETPPPPTVKDIVDFMPEGLNSASGFRPSEVEKSKLAEGTLRQLRAITSVLERLGLKPDEVDHVWVGSNVERGDLILCARTKRNVDIKSIKLTLDQRGSKRMEGLDVLPVGDGGKNALCLVNPTTVLSGRLATMERALRGGASPARKGFDAIGSEAPFWFAGDGKASEAHIGGGSVPLFDIDVAALRGATSFGAGVTVGEKLEIAMNWQFGDAGSAKSAHDAIRKYFEDRKRDGGSVQSGDSSEGGRGGGGGLRGASIDFVESEDSVAARARTVQSGLVHQQRGRRGTTKQSGGAGREEGPSGLSGDGVGGGRRQRGDDGGGTEGPSGLAGEGGAVGGRRGQPRGQGRGQSGGDGDSSAGQRFAGAGLRRITIEYSLRDPEGPNLQLSMRYNTPLVPFSAIAAKALGNAAKGDETFSGTLDPVSQGLTALLTKTGDPVKGMRRDKDTPIVYGYSWMCELLPHLGYDGLYAKLKSDKSWIEKEDTQIVAGTTIAEFLDPAEVHTRWKGYPFDGFALTHFVGMAGVEATRTAVAAELPRTDPHAGVFGYERIARLDEIKDGAANTILLIGAGKLKGLWIQGGGATIRGARDPIFDPMTGFGNASHPNKGAFAVMADGSVREIAPDIDPAVFKALCTIAGQEKTP